MELYDEIELSHELNRKSLETLEWIEDNLKYMGRNQKSTAIRVFQMLTRGLIDPEINLSVDNNWNKNSGFALCKRAAFVNDKGDILTIHLDYESCKMTTVSKKVGSSFEKKVKEFDTKKEVDARCQFLSLTAIRKGYELISGD